MRKNYTEIRRTKYQGQTAMNYHIEKMNINVQMKWSSTGYQLEDAWNCEGKCYFEQFPYRISKHDLAKIDETLRQIREAEETN